MTDSEEGKRVADTIIEQKNRYNLANKDFAILYRTNSQSRIFEEQLRRYNIAYRIYGGLSFYSRKEIKDLVSYLRMVVNDKDDEALKRVINYPKRGIGNSTIEQISQIADDNEISMWQVLGQMEFTSRAAKNIAEFTGIIKACKAKAVTANAYDAAVFIAKASGILGELKSDTSLEGQGRLENVNSLLDGIKEFVEDDELAPGEEVATSKSLAAFLQTISLMTDQDKDGADQETVTLMSVHSAKGLEFKSVFVVGLEENLFPSYQAMITADQIDEERRLFYVAITRAEEHLTLTYANSRYHFGNMRFNDPSRFIEEIDQKNYDPLTILNKKPDFGESSSSFGEPKLLGNFKTKTLNQPQINIDPKDFVPNRSEDIKVGQKVIHLKFGQGTVKSIDERMVASIVFPALNDNPEKRIMLQYAKLQIVEE